MTSGPTGVAERATTPDLARGLMLVLIALANVHLFLVGRPPGVRGYPALTTASTVDRVVAFGQMLLVDGRAYPLFAVLVGYGFVRLGERHPETVVRRRALALVGIGAAHGVLLFAGDIIGAYGLVALVLAPILTGRQAASPRALLVVAGALAGFCALLGATQGLPTPGPTLPSIAVPDAAAALGMRVGEWIGTALFSALLVAPAVLVGAWAARRGVLDDPGAHRRLLATWALVGLLAGALAGVPAALAAAGWWSPPLPVALLGGVAHTAGGYAGALGYLGLLGLTGLVVRGTWVAGLLAGTGTWSMTGYVAQSVVFTALFAVWAGDLGAGLGVADAALVGLATWVVTVLVAGPLGRAGHRGPLEILLRRLTYAPRR